MNMKPLAALSLSLLMTPACVVVVNDDDSGETGSGTDTNSDADDTGDETGDGDGETGEGGCTEISVEDWISGGQSSILGVVAPNIGADIVDSSQIEVYGSTTLDFEYDLGSEDNLNYASCTHCVRVLEDIEDADTIAREYFQESGTIVFSQKDQVNGMDMWKGTLTDVVLIEVEIVVDDEGV